MLPGCFSVHEVGGTTETTVHTAVQIVSRRVLSTETVNPVAGERGWTTSMVHREDGLVALSGQQNVMRCEWIYLLGMLLQLTDADMLNPSAQGSNTSSLPKTRIVNASSLSQPCALQLAASGASAGPLETPTGSSGVARVFSSRSTS